MYYRKVVLYSKIQLWLYKLNKKYGIIGDNFYLKTKSYNYKCVVLSNENYKKLNLKTNKVFYQQYSDDIIDMMNLYKIIEIQFISVVFNQVPLSLETALSVLLTSFDISTCQCAIFKNDEVIKTGMTYMASESFLGNKLFYNTCEYTNSTSRIIKYIKKLDLDVIISSAGVFYNRFNNKVYNAALNGWFGSLKCMINNAFGEKGIKMWSSKNSKKKLSPFKEFQIQNKFVPKKRTLNELL